MPAIRRRGNIGERFAQRAAASAGDYVQGVEDSPKSWAANTAAAAGNWAAGVQQAVTDGTFGKGVRKAGDEKHRSGVVVKGGARYAQGVSQGQNAYEEGVRPYLDEIERTTLPPRGTRGSEQNYQRAVTMGKALNAKRKQIQKGG